MENRIEVSLMEECIICYEETEDFTFFSCGHKACNACFPKLHQCPFCQPDTKIQIIPQRVQLHHQSREDYCKLCCSVIIIMMFCVWCLHIVDLF